MNKFNIKNSRFKIQDSTKKSSIFNLQSLIGNSGFSFMELMTVVAIIAILIIASMPVFRNYTRTKNLKEGTNMIVSAFRKTRDAAITYRKNYRIVFDAVNDAVAIYKVGDDVNPAEKWTKLPEFVAFDTTNFAAISNMDFPVAAPDTNLYSLEFKPNGGFSGVNGHITLKDTTDNGDTKIIYFYSLTGKVRVQ